MIYVYYLFICGTIYIIVLVFRDSDALPDLLPFVRFKKLVASVCNFTKKSLLHGSFSLFLNCTKSTKSRKASLINRSSQSFLEKNDFKNLCRSLCQSQQPYW